MTKMAKKTFFKVKNTFFKTHVFRSFIYRINSINVFFSKSHRLIYNFYYIYNWMIVCNIYELDTFTSANILLSSFIASACVEPGVLQNL